MRIIPWNNDVSERVLSTSLFKSPLLVTIHLYHFFSFIYVLFVFAGQANFQPLTSLLGTQPAIKPRDSSKLTV